ncbi:hypothetical protein [Stappia taiwanensis]|uniref:hypothetical protein n=1 Tax=Stappia taiwanensis TaxID=992267 RepID=UPI001AD8D060|nr:hypothetical protein [Stappia taiwanensis]
MTLSYPEAARAAIPIAPPSPVAPEPPARSRAPDVTSNRKSFPAADVESAPARFSSETTPTSYFRNGSIKLKKTFKIIKRTAPERNRNFRPSKNKINS